jgi:hypothetical protein
MHPSVEKKSVRHHGKVLAGLTTSMPKACMPDESGVTYLIDMASCLAQGRGACHIVWLFDVYCPTLSRACWMHGVGAGNAT